MENFEALAAIALDLTKALSASDRHTRLLDALGRVIPFDAAALMRLEKDELVPLAVRGVTTDAIGRRFRIEDEPRLKSICTAQGPVLFATDDSAPDPFDGMLEGEPSGEHRIHACFGCALRVEGRLIGT